MSEAVKSLDAYWTTAVRFLSLQTVSLPTQTPYRLHIVSHCTLVRPPVLAVRFHLVPKSRMREALLSFRGVSIQQKAYHYATNSKEERSQ
jgi:hypothetical protein